MEAILRLPHAVEAVDPLSLVPDPGKMSDLYIDARQGPENPGGYADGMSLACAIPNRPYDEIVADYESDRYTPGFSPVKFWDENFTTPDFSRQTIVAPEDMDIDTYMRLVRPILQRTSFEDDSFDFALPYPYPGAGGRFSRHLFPWDAYHIMKGYAADGEWGQIIDVVDDMEYEIMMLGYMPNGNSGMYASRFQTPYFSHSVRMLSEKFGDAALRRYLPALEREHNYHMLGRQDLLRDEVPLEETAASRCVVQMPDGSFLNRYWDDADGPRLESYREDVELGELVVKGLSGAIREQRLHKFYKDIRAAAASGWDFSSRWFADSMSMEEINTTDIVPIDLNCLILDSEETLAAAYAAEARATIDTDDASRLWAKSKEYWQMAESRKIAINTYNWDPESKTFHDYNHVQQSRTDVLSSAMAYPLYVGMADEEQSFGVAKALRNNLLLAGGFACTLNETGEQWDGKNVWAPPNWAAVRGLARMAHILTEKGVDAEELFELSGAGRANFMSGIEKVFDMYGIIPEKINGVDPTMLAGGGEYSLVKVLNMTLETYRAMKAWTPRETGGCLPIARMALAA
jgi:alpha,alpha-trehalase